MATLANGASRIARYGPGGQSDRPEYNRWVYLTNPSGLTMFLPENSEAERNAIYNNFPYKTQYVRGYGTTGTGGVRLWQNSNAIGTGPCWSTFFGGTYATPAACASGFTQEGSVVNAYTNPLSYTGLTTQHTNVGWQFYLQYRYGCPDTFRMGASTRYCYRTADSSYGATTI